MLSYDYWCDHHHVYANACQHELEVLMTNIQGNTKYYTKPTTPKRMQKDFNEVLEVLQQPQRHIIELHSRLLEMEFSMISDVEYNKRWDKFWAKLKEQ